MAYRSARAIRSCAARRSSCRDWPAGAPPVTRRAAERHPHRQPRRWTRRGWRGSSRRSNALRPDLVLIAGDFIAGHDASSGARRRAAAGRAARAAARAARTVAVLGNHDTGPARGAVRAALSAAGVTVLENAAVRARAAGDRRDRRPSTRHDDRAPRRSRRCARLAGAPLVLTHSPDIAPRAARRRAAAARRAHPLRAGRAAVSAPLGSRSPLPRYRCGVGARGRAADDRHRRARHQRVPLRIGAPPDLWLLTLGPLAGASKRSNS